MEEINVEAINSTEKGGRGMKQWIMQTIVSVRGTIAGMCLLIIVVTGVGTGALSEVSCDVALGDTRDHSSDTLTTCFGSSTDALDSIVAQLLFISSSASESAVYAFLQRAVVEAERLNLVADTVERNSRKDGTWTHRQMGYVWSQLVTVVRANSVNILGASFTAEDASASCQLRPDVPGGVALVLQHEDNATHIEYGPAMPITADMNRSAPTLWLPAGSKAIANELARGTIGPGSLWEYGDVKWGVLEIFGDFLGTFVVSRMEDPTNSVGSVQTMIIVSLANVQTFLAELASKTHEATGADTRIYTSIASSWMVTEMTKRTGYPQDVLDSLQQVGVLTGVSHGLGVEKKVRFDDFFQVNKTHSLMMQDVHADDPIIRGVAQAIQRTPGSYAHFSQQQAERALRIVRPTVPTDFTDSADDMFMSRINETHVQEGHYVNVRRIQDGHGLDWWMTVSLSEEHVMRNVSLASRAAAASTLVEREKVSDEVNRTRLQSRFFIVGLAVVLVVLSVLATHFVLKALLVMQDEMANVAQMNFINTTKNVKASSMFYEMREMQANFLMMARNLLEYKAYVPEAVLGSNTSLPAGDPGAASKRVSPPTGDVTVMFTDIQGSTKLWKRSAQDMNAAIEQHNAIIRAVYREYNGYEVKTIGDSFMLTFKDPVLAIRTALEIQHRFKQAKWPERLRLPAAGLVVRIGLHHGSTIAEENPITGRVDYRGSTVNKASRVEAKAKGGTICISRDMTAIIEGRKNGWTDIQHSPVLHPLGPQELRGLGPGHELFLLAPKSLQCRFSVSHTDCTPVEDADTQIDKENASDDRSVASSGSRLGIGSTLKKTELFLMKASGTVAVCKLNTKISYDTVYDDFNLIVRCAAEAAISFDGQIAAVVASEVLITFNTSKRCRQHVTSALRLAEYLETRTQSIMRLGIATGDFLHGNVGTSKQRYTTSLGTPLIVAEAAAEYAEEAGFYALFADATRESNALERNDTQHVAECLFLADKWFYTKESRTVAVYQVSTEGLKALMSVWGDGNDAMQCPLLTASGRSDAGASLGEPNDARAAASLFGSLFKNASKEYFQRVVADISLQPPSLLCTNHQRILKGVCYESLSEGYRVRVNFSRAPQDELKMNARNETFVTPIRSNVPTLPPVPARFR